MTVSLLLLVASLLPVSLSTFDIACESRPSENAQARPEQIRFSINLTDQSWCKIGSCAHKISKIAFFDEKKIYLVDEGSQTHMARIAVNRETGQYIYKSAMTYPMVFSFEKVGICTLAEYTAHGPLPWLG